MNEDLQYRYAVSQSETLTTITADDIREVFPINQRELKEDFDLDDGDRRFAFSNRIGGTLVFTNANGDFDYFLEIEQSGKKCKSLTLFMLQVCGDFEDPQVYRTCKLRPVDGSWDLDKCTVVMKVISTNAFSCIDENKDVEFNVFDIAAVRYAATVARGFMDFVDYTSDNYDRDDPGSFGGQQPGDIGYIAYKITYSTSSPLYHFYYGREVLELPTGDPSPGAGWILIDDSGGIKSWARPLSLFDRTTLFPEGLAPGLLNNSFLYLGGEIFTWNWFGIGDSESFPAIDNGMKITDLIAQLVSQYCGLPFRSNFFAINADAEFVTSYPDLPDHTNQVDLLFQKSDVKRNADANNANKGLWTFDKMIKAICTFYNLYYFIRDGYFRIEHASFFPRPQTLDLTEVKWTRYVQGTRQYTYIADKMPKFEKFKAMEAVHADFVGVPIEYPGDCVQATGPGREKTYDVGEVTADLELVLANYSPDSNAVSDQGFVIICCEKNIDGNLYVQGADPYLDDRSRLNGVMSWAYLHDKFHRWDRIQKNGYMNNAYSEFATTIPVKKRRRITIPFCCTDTVDLTGSVMTEMGEASIGAATFIPYQEVLEVDLMYPDTIGNLACLRPDIFKIVDHADPSSFSFQTKFGIPGTYTTQIEWLLGSGPTGVITVTGDEDGIRAHDFPFTIGGDETFKFRKRVLCDDGGVSPWTPWVSLFIGGESSSCQEVADVVSSIIYLGNSVFRSYWKFKFVSSDGIQYPMELEVTRPDIPVYVVQQFGQSNYGTYFEKVFNIYIPGSGTPPSGLYSFRFRWNCDTTTGEMSGWSPPLTVSI